MRLHEAKIIFMIGVKGVGMTALAEVLCGWGRQVSGSDTGEIFPTDPILRAAGVSVCEGFAKNNIPKAVDLVIRSTAYGEDHVEVRAAHERGTPVMTYPEALAELMEGKQGIAIAGSHGKTTTTALFGHVMAEAGLDPTVIVGSTALNWKSNARVGQSKYVVIEADEYQNKLALYHPRGAIITNVDWDHPDFFPTAVSYQKVFDDFREKILKSGGWVVEHPRRFARNDNVVLPPALSGEHNRQNLALVHEAAVNHLGISEDVFWNAIATFKGTARRFEIKGTMQNGALVVDDYGHHPTEIRATLTGARTRYPEKRIIAVFHPHTYTRTKTYLADFGCSFSDADIVLVLDIYGSAREQQGGVHARDVVEGVRGAGRPVEYTPTINDAVVWLRAHAKEHDVIITIGAGDVWKVGEALVADGTVRAV